MYLFMHVCAYMCSGMQDFISFFVCFECMRVSMSKVVLRYTRDRGCICVCVCVCKCVCCACAGVRVLVCVSLGLCKHVYLGLNAHDLFYKEFPLVYKKGNWGFAYFPCRNIETAAPNLHTNPTPRKKRKIHLHMLLQFNFH